MVRILMLVVAMALVSCAGTQAPGSSGPTDTVSPSASSDSGEPEASASAEPWVDPALGLAIVRFPDSNSPVSHIFVVEAGDIVRQVTGISRTSPGASDPAWSGDRTQIAFGPPKTGAGMVFDVGVANVDGTGERVLGQGQNPQWSPEDDRILFGEVDDVTSEPQSMYVVDVASGEVSDIGQGFNAHWLPDGRISFNRMVGGVSVLYILPNDGGAPLEFAQGADGYWSPDGSAVLLVREGVIWLAEADGSGAHELVDGYDPLWSPDGDLIAFAYDVSQDGLPVLAVVDMDGNEVWSGVVGGSPTWSPDGTRLAVEIAVPTPMVQVLDAASGEVIWEAEGSQPAW